VKKTYDAYNAVPEVVAKLDLPAKVMEQLIIGTYGNFDPLQSTAAKGAAARNEYLNGITPEFKAQRVQEIIGTSPADLRSFADNFAQMTPASNRAIIGNRKKIEKDAELFEAFIEL
jgi:Zn-dependent M16 (insulinase) family peptidase